MKVQIDYADLQRQRGRVMLVNALFMLKLGVGAVVWFLCAGMAAGTPAFMPVLIGGPIIGFVVLILACIDQVKDMDYGRGGESAGDFEPTFKSLAMPSPYDWGASQSPLKFPRLNKEKPY
jgi:hypothetical protein